ncbi:hypothetical protein D3C81_2285110 [compost metagenome]
MKNSVKVAMIGFDSGSTTEYRILNSPAPSIRAASSRLSGRLWKKERMTIILKALDAAGSTTAQ